MNMNSCHHNLATSHAPAPWPPPFDLLPPPRKLAWQAIEIASGHAHWPKHQLFALIVAVVVVVANLWAALWSGFGLAWAWAWTWVSTWVWVLGLGGLREHFWLLLWRKWRWKWRWKWKWKHGPSGSPIRRGATAQESALPPHLNLTPGWQAPWKRNYP